MREDHPEAGPGGQPRRHQHGNAMILMPVGVLVMLVLAAIGVDTTLLFRSQMELENTAAALANDVAAAVSTGSLFDDDEAIQVDEDLLAALADTHEQAAGLRLAPTCDVTITVGAEPAARARCRGTARLIFRGAVGLARTIPVEATESSVLDSG